MSLSKISLFFIFVFLLAFSQSPAMAQAAKKQAKPASKNWLVNCATRKSGTLSCALRQTITIQKTGQVFLVAQVAKTDPKGLPFLMFRLPHNVFLQKGVTLSIDAEKKHTLPIVRADQKGSYASLKLEGNLMSLMRTGTKLKLTFYSINGKAVNVALPLKGFAESSKHLK